MPRALFYSRDVKEATAKRLTELSEYGNAWLYLFAIAAASTALGSLLGWALADNPGDGAAAGLLTSIVVWLLHVIAAHRQLAPYEGHHREDDMEDEGQG